MEVLADCMHKNRTVFVQELQNVRLLDKDTHAEVESLRKEESELLDELQQSIKEGQQVDEASLLARFQSISDRRAACTQRYEHQAAIVQNIYDQLDGQINYLSEETERSLGPNLDQFAFAFLPFLILRIFSFLIAQTKKLPTSHTCSPPPRTERSGRRRTRRRGRSPRSRCCFLRKPFWLQTPTNPFIASVVASRSETWSPATIPTARSSGSTSHASASHPR